MGKYGAAVAQLTAAQKPGRGAPPYSRWVNRRIGRRLAAAAHVLGMTPDAVTLMSACTTLVALILLVLVSPTWWLGLATSGLLLLGYALDAADGQLARLRGGGTTSGEFFDHVVDATKLCLLHTAVLISFYRFQDVSSPLLLVPLGYLTVSSVYFFSFVLVEKLLQRPGRTSQPPKTGSGLLQTLIVTPIDYATLCLCFLFLGWRTGFQFLYSALFSINLIVAVTALVRWSRQLRTLDTSTRSHP